jgi:hypothetical protein
MSYASMGLLASLWCVFAVSGWGKVRSRATLRAFADSLRPLPLLPARLVIPVAATVTAGELALVLGLGWSMVATAAGWSSSRAGAGVVLGLTLLLLAVLTTGVVLAIRRDTGARCACFGANQQTLSRRHVVRNAVLLAIAATALLLVAVRRPHPLELPGVLIALVAGAIAALFLIRLDDLVDLFLPTRTAPPPGGNRTRTAA